MMLPEAVPPAAITQMVVTFHDGSTRTFVGQGIVSTYKTEIRNEKNSRMTILEASMKLEEEWPNE